MERCAIPPTPLLVVLLLAGPCTLLIMIELEILKTSQLLTMRSSMLHQKCNRQTTFDRNSSCNPELQAFISFEAIS